MKGKKFLSIFILLILGFSLAGFKLIAKDFKNSPASKLSQVSTSSQSPQIKSGKNLTLYVATDIHYLAKSLTDNGKAFNEFMNSGDGKQLNYIDQILGAFAKEIKEKKPDFLIVSGDLTTNGEKQSHLELANIFKNI
jgi:3',5'-cyclic AMP phosphodiesterase CpdA